MGVIEIFAAAAMGGVFAFFVTRVGAPREARFNEALDKVLAGQKKTNELLEAIAVRVQRMELIVYQMGKAIDPKKDESPS